jgi:hypothetical protein
MNQKRKMWLTTCGVFTLMWGFLGMFFLPFLFLAFCSAVMGLIPVGVPEAEAYALKHDPAAWQSHHR